MFLKYNVLYTRVHYRKCNLCFQHKAFHLSGKTGSRSSPVSVNNNFHQQDVFKELISQQQCGNMIAL